MHILDKIAYQNLKLNKKRTIGTILGIILSVALICAVSGMFTSLKKSLIIQTINNKGEYHLILYNKDEKDLLTLQNNRDIKSINILRTLGYASHGLNNNDKPYFHLYSFDDAKSFDELKIKLEEGKYPQNSSEIIINSEITYEKQYQIGDIITLDVGIRETIDGYELNEKNPLEENETINIKDNKQYKIVGFFKRNYALEPHGDSGYSAISLSSSKEKLASIYIALKNPYNYEEDIAQILDKNYDSSNSFTEDYSINSELIRWQTFKFSDNTVTAIYSVLAIVLIIIVGTSIFCIKNSFDISTIEKRKMHGMLLSIGATTKQIRKSILKEGLILAIIAIPLGIICGILAVFILVNLINYLMADIEASAKIVFYINIIPLILASMLGLLTIYLSSLASSRKAKKITPLEYIRNNKDFEIESKKLRCPKIIQKVFNIGGLIAYKNLKRSKKKYRTTVISLTISILTFIALNSFINYGINTTKFYYEGISYDIEVNAPEKNLDDLIKITTMSGIENYSYYQESNNYLEISDKTKITISAQNNLMKNGDCYYDEENDINECQDAKSLGIEILALNKKAYQKYVQDLKLDYEKVKHQGILINNYLEYTDGVEKMQSIYKFQDNEEIEGLYDNKPLKVILSKVTDIRPSGLERSFNQGGYLIVEEGFNNLEYTPKFLTLNVENPTKFTKDVENLYPQVNIQNIQELVKAQATISLIFQIFLYGFITVITLIGITNIFNTITANVSLRQKEFAMLKSIGMTKKEFNNMINLETLFYSTKSLFYGITLGLIFAFLIYKSFTKRIDLGYQIPYIPILIAIISVFILVFIIMRYSVKKINKQNIIETIRKENI